MSRNDDINMARFLAGEMSSGEEIAFRRELGTDPVQMTELKRMEKHWQYFDENPSGSNWNSGRAWYNLHQRMGREGLLQPHAVKTGNRRLYRNLRVAASVLLILALGIPALYFGLLRERQVATEVNRSAERGISTVDLPDGSRVTLNQGASISYKGSFSQARSLELRGEAYFEVMSDPRHPFTVHTGEVAISVLGTSFNVKRAPRSRDVEVYVTSGRVRMTLGNSGTSMVLEPGEIGTSENRRLTRSVQNDQNYISWKTKDFKFVDTALEDVLAELEEAYHVKINTAHADLEQMRITTTYSQQSIDAILETICTAFGLSVSSGQEGYSLSNQ